MASQGVLLDVVLTEEQIRTRVAELGAQISAEVKGRTQHVVGVLDNGFIMMSDLVRQLSCPAVCQFVKLETRDTVEDGHERREIFYTPILDIKDQDFLLVDAVLHTGITLEHLVHQLMIKGARAVRTAVLIDKTEERRVSLKADYWGFREVKGRFLVGYGMGHQELYRNLPYVADLKS